ncbi:MAG: hypothetical protein KKB20_28630 [Proteobacteria bacterium]|nr:hypothetical protein [Pseudomonadota bacterium]
MKTRFLILALLAASLILNPSFCQATADKDSVYLETIGGFLGSHMYTTFAYIGVTADAYAKNVYTAAQVKKMMEHKAATIKDVIGNLKKIESLNLPEGDRRFLTSSLEVFDLLLVEAEALATLVSSSNQESLEKYDQAREQSWYKMKRLLQIK